MKLSREAIVGDPRWRWAVATFLGLIAMEACVIAGAAGVLKLLAA